MRMVINICRQREKKRKEQEDTSLQSERRTRMKREDRFLLTSSFLPFSLYLPLFSSLLLSFLREDDSLGIDEDKVGGRNAAG